MVVIKKGTLKLRRGDKFSVPVHAIAEATTKEQLSAIAAKGAEVIAEAEAKRADIDKNYPAVIALRDKTNVLEQSSSRISKRTSTLWKLSQGQLYDFEHTQESGTNAPPSGAAYMRLEAVQGRTEQERTQGFQLLNQKIAEIEDKGMKCTVNADGLRGHISGTSTGAFYTDYTKVTPILLPPGTYTLSVNSDAKDLNVQLLASASENDGYSSSVFGATNTSKTVTTTASLYVRVRLQVWNVGVPMDTDFSVMLEAGSSAHAWEPYTGGLPSPSLDYPQELCSVESLHVRHTDSQGNTVAQRTIAPPRPLNAVGECRDVCDVENGVWMYANTVQCYDGSENWQIGGSGARYVTAPQSAQDCYDGYCDQFTVAKAGASVRMHLPYDGYLRIYNYSGEISTLKALLASRPMTVVYPAKNVQTEPIGPEDLEFLRSLADIPVSDTLTVTDQDGREVPWLNEYIISLPGVKNLQTRLKSGAIEDSDLHLGFYLDENGDLCQKED